VDYEGFEDPRIRHLEMIQSVVSRLGANGFLVRGWAVTLAGAFLGFAVNGDRWALALAAIAPVLAFWGLDAVFLRSERLFRELYECVRTAEPEVPPFFMAATGPVFAAVVWKRGSGELLSWSRTACQQSLVVFYLALVVGALVVALLIHGT
jgi:hypothetical protein